MFHTETSLFFTPEGPCFVSLSFSIAAAQALTANIS